MVTSWLFLRTATCLYNLQPATSDLQPATCDLRLVWLLAALALVSLLFAFGTPLYYLLFYGVPGYKQLHSAFRWVFPYTVAMTALSGFGLQMLQNWLEGGKNTGQAGARAARSARTIARWIAGVTLVAGVVALAAALVSMLAPGPFAALGQRIVDSSDLARAVFANGQDFWGYQWRNVFHFGLFATLAGLWLLYATRNPRSTDRDSRAAVPSWILPAAAILILVLDLFLVLGDFNPAADPDLLKTTPKSIAVLQQDKDLWRVTSFEGPGTTKTLNANTAWLNGLQDVRGYNSIIPRQYVEYMKAIEPQGQLLYNRISPFYDPASLDDPLTDLLGVKYVVSELPLDVSGWEKVYDEEVRIYRNADAFPRAFIAARAELAPPGDVLTRTRQVDLHDVVVLEAGDTALREGEGLAASGFKRLPAEYAGRMPADELPPAASPQVRTATVSDYGLRQVLVDVNLSDRGWLVLTDAWFPGWKAYLRPFGETGEGVDAEGNPLELELPVFRADGNFRAVYIPQDGQWTVRFVYSPRSVQTGAYVSFLAAICLMLLAGLWAWGRFYREVDDENAEVRRVAKNSAVLMISVAAEPGHRLRLRHAAIAYLGTHRRRQLRVCHLDLWLFRDRRALWARNPPYARRRPGERPGGPLPDQRVGAASYYLRPFHPSGDSGGGTLCRRR